jgi:hypothetical protein
LGISCGGRPPRTVERRLERVRKLWEAEPKNLPIYHQIDPYLIHIQSPERTSRSCEYSIQYLGLLRYENQTKKRNTEAWKRGYFFAATVSR